MFSPTVDEHGFASPHTVVQVVTDDMPFLPDSLTTELTRHGFGLHIAIHSVFVVERSPDGELLAVLGDDEARPGGVDTIRESYHHIEIDRQADAAVLDQLRLDLIRVLGDVRAANEDQVAMRERAISIAGSLDAEAMTIDREDREEAADFLRWLADDHFTFLGYREYELVPGPGEEVLRSVTGSGLGILRNTSGKVVSHPLATLPPDVRRKVLEPVLLNLTKANSRATVQRGNYLDYVGIKRFDANGQPVGERRFLGLYPRNVAKQSLFDIPIVRRKMRAVLDRAADPRHGYEAQVLVDILDNYPRDELLQSGADDLYSDAIAILELQHRQRLRLRVRRDDFGRFFSCFVDLPLGRLTEAVRVRIRETLMTTFHGVHAEESTLVTDSAVARLHFVIYAQPGVVPDHDTPVIEARLASALRTWTDDLADALVEEFGEERGVLLHHRYASALPSGYQDDHTARTAVSDIRRLEALLSGDPGDGLAMHLYRPHETIDPAPRLKLYRHGEPLTLSDVLPLLENMGTKVVDERPYEIRPAGADPVWIYDFGLHREALADIDVAEVRDRFQETLAAVWRGEIENDRFNWLVLRAGLRGRDVTVLRAYVKYLRQVGTTFSRDYMAATLVGNPDVASRLVELFAIRFDPDFDSPRRSRSPRQAGRRRDRGPHRSGREPERGPGAAQPSAAGDGDPADQLLPDASRGPRGLPARAQARSAQHPRPAAAAADVRDLRLLPARRGRAPARRAGRPRRAALVGPAGGLPHRDPRAGQGPDRQERRHRAGRRQGRVRREVATPGPGRAAGRGRVLLPHVRARAARRHRQRDRRPGRAAAPRRPPRRGRPVSRRGRRQGHRDVLRHGERDLPRVRVLARRRLRLRRLEGLRPQGDGDHRPRAPGSRCGGTSGPSASTCRTRTSPWRASGTCPVTSSATACCCRGTFDWSPPSTTGTSSSTRTPIRRRGFDERARLFALPRSSWADYDPALISPGGGVFPRTAKAVPLSDEMRRALDVDAEALPPDELIRAILRAPVDLLWNGGVGTYVKASTEANTDVGDKNNDTVRIDATELRCRVVGEGGNLGFTQRGRIEFALHGGHINTDAIDNSAGVNCSDHEVNIKILLDRVVRDGDLTGKQRDALLAAMTDDVAAQVLGDNDGQTRALYIAAAQAAAMRDVHVRYLDALERSGRLDRALEQLPTADELRTGPRRAVGSRCRSSRSCSPTARSRCSTSCSPPTCRRTRSSAGSSSTTSPRRCAAATRTRSASTRCGARSVATRVTNSVVDRAGTTFVFRLTEETGMSAPDVARAHTAAREIFGLRALWSQIEALDDVVSTDTQITLLLEVRKLAERATRWLLRNRIQPLDIAATTEFFEPGVRELALLIPKLVTENRRSTLERTVDDHVRAGVPEDLAWSVGTLPDLISALDITTVARSTQRPVEEVAGVYFALDEHLMLDWLRGRILDLPRDDRWQSLARAALREDLHVVHSAITAEVLRTIPPGAQGREQVYRWIETIDAATNRCLRLLSDIINSGRSDLATLSVALREIRTLVQASTPETG